MSVRGSGNILPKGLGMPFLTHHNPDVRLYAASRLVTGTLVGVMPAALGVARLPLAYVALLVLILSPGCGGDDETPPEAARTVTVMTLREESIVPAVTFTGVAEPYRETELGFEVSGRLQAIVDVGQMVEVLTWKNEAGEVVHEGDILAQIDSTTYEQRKEAAELKLAAAEARLKTLLVELNEVGDARVARAKAQRDAANENVNAAKAAVESADSTRRIAEVDLERNRKLYMKDRAISKSELDKYQNAYDTAVANLSQEAARLSAVQQLAFAGEAAVTEAEALQKLQAKKVAATRAEIKELENAVRQATTDLERCTLRAPFPGRVTYVHASHGDFVQAGTPVVTLTLIDPIKVSVTVASDTERDIKPGHHAKVFPAGLEGSEYEKQFLTGTVFEKGSVADPSTRTFRIDIIVRNARRLMNVSVPGEVWRISFRQMLPAVQRRFGEGGPLFVGEGCMLGKDETRTVYRVKGWKFGVLPPRPYELLRGVLPLERLQVTPTGEGPDDYMHVLSWRFRRVTPGDGPQLEYGDVLLNFDGLDQDEAEIERQIENGVVLEQPDWAMRPGDLVPLTFDMGAAVPGLYVPKRAIVALNEDRSVYVLEGDRVKKVPVTLHEASRQRLRVEGPGLVEGVRVVVRGAHYCHDGAKVVVLRDEKPGNRTQ